VNEVGVAAAHQRSGVGKRLIATILDHAIARGCSEAWVATEEGNTFARALYLAGAGDEDPDRAVVYTWKLKYDGNDD
jgi:GNAT superfamily N-acetyltransferase